MERFEAFIERDIVKRTRPDTRRAEALRTQARTTLGFITTLEVTQASASTVLSMAYESLRQHLEALAFEEGFKVYSHEAYTAYLLDKKLVSLAHRFDRLRKLRNGAHYYGRTIEPTVASTALVTVLDSIDELASYDQETKHS